VDKPTKTNYSKANNLKQIHRRKSLTYEELIPMSLAEKRMATQLQQTIGNKKIRPTLSEALKKVGVRSAFGVSAAELHKHDRRGK
jgi:hypothetical protein